MKTKLEIQEYLESLIEYSPIDEDLEMENWWIEKPKFDYEFESYENYLNRTQN